MKDKLGFEDGLLTCLEILNKTDSNEDARARILQLFESYKLVEHEARIESIKDELGLWGIL